MRDDAKRLHFFCGSLERPCAPKKKVEREACEVGGSASHNEKGRLLSQTASCATILCRGAEVGRHQIT